LRAAAIQLNSTDEYDRNLQVAERLVRGAAAEGAELVVLPEKWTVLGPPDAIRSSAEPLDGPALTAAAALALTVAIYAQGKHKNALFGLVPAGIGLAYLIYYAVEGRRHAEPPKISDANGVKRAA